MWKKYKDNANGRIRVRLKVKQAIAECSVHSGFKVPGGHGGVPLSSPA